MQRDIRETSLYRQAQSLCEALLRPGTGQIFDAAEVNVAPDGSHAVFAGTLVDKLEGRPPTRICSVNLASGEIRVLTFGPNSDRLPKYSPDGRVIAFLSDRLESGNYQLYLLDAVSGAARPTAAVDGWVEYFHWSPDGQRILLGVAGHGADISGGQGAITSRQAGAPRPAWTPIVESGDESYRWRSAWVYELTGKQAHQASPEGCNLWEVVWCGNDALTAVISPTPGEGAWYKARLHRFALEGGGDSRELYSPRDQLGWPAASFSGRHVAVVEAVSSDRWVVAGDLRLIDTQTGHTREVDTHGVDITYTEWRSDRTLLLAGHRGFETVVGVYDLASTDFKVTWASRELTTAGRYASVSGIGESGDCVLIGESFQRAPEIALLHRGDYRSVRSFDAGHGDVAKVIDSVEPLVWNAPDGLEIQGWLLRPKGTSPQPLVLFVHGGPVWHWRPTWLGRYGAAGPAVLMLLERGYQILFSNPRGSSGRGQDFARRVAGDMGGAETFDHLCGLDSLIARGIADPKRLGVTGISHGGFMTSWLITQDARFAAAVSVAPATNFVTARLIGNLPDFVDLFLADRFDNPGGKYFERSPIMHAHKVRTPTLNICGALDRCTPPEEAMQFHHALLENNVESVLITYPEEGHGIRKLPAALDYTARLVAWFETHLG